jgi:signal transduction histidine kinase
MSTPQNFDNELLKGGGAPALIIRMKAQILEQFCSRVNTSLPAARASSHPVLIDTLPLFITGVALAMSPDHQERFASQHSNIALQHGNERARFTNYSLQEVVAEYQILRELLVLLLRDHSDPTYEQWDALHQSIDEGIAEASAAYVAVHDGLREMFTAALGHDFRGPLQTAMNYIELLRREAAPSQREEFADRALSNLKRIDQMIVDLLNVSRSNAGERMVLEFIRCDVTSLVREVLEDVASRAGVSIAFESANPVVAVLNEQKMRQAVHNLVENAAKYGLEGGTVTVRLVESHDRVMISVHNCGNPIPRDDLHTLFIPYRRTSDAERSGKSGWGLGLALVQLIAEAHGGSVGVQSSSEAGTTFTIDVLRDPRDFTSDVD